jgi:hypothetical protein
MRVVVSLSTIPSRVPYLHKIIDQLQNQTYHIDKIYLNLPYFSNREKCYYPDLKLKNVQVIRCEDYGPITKLYPVLEYENHPDTIIITVDDDVAYLPDRIETLVKWCQRYPDAAFGGVGYIIGNWYNYMGKIKYSEEATKVSFLQGYSGCAYRRKFFGNGEDLIDYSGAPKESYYHDDVWISGYLARKNIDRMVHPDPFIDLNNKERLPNGLSDDIYSNITKFFPVVKYFQDKNVFNESQTAPWYNTLSIIIFLIIAFVIIILLCIFYMIFKNKKPVNQRSLQINGMG